MRRSPRPITVTAVVLLAVLVYAAWSLWQVRSDLLGARAAAATLRADFGTGDRRATAAALSDFQEHARRADTRTDGPLFAALSRLPVVGDDVSGLRLASRAVATIADDGLTPLVRTSAGVSAGSFLPHDGRVPIQRIAGLHEPVAAASGAFESAVDTLAGGDAGGYVGPFAATYEELQREVGDVADLLAAAETAALVLPGMLGSDGGRAYVAVFQTNAELRTTGGVPGASALITAEGGRLAMTRQTSTLPQAPEPVVPLSGRERFLYDPKLATYYQDVNLTPHFPRTAEIVAAHWRRTFAEQVDGVVAYDPVALSYLLAGLGPVTVDGVTLTADNATEILLHEAYQRLDREAQNDFFAKVARTVFDRLVAGAGYPRATLEALARGVEERRLLVSSFEGSEQAELSGSRVAGEVMDEGERPQLGIYLNDATASKLSWFLDHEVTGVEVESCADGVQRIRGRLELRSSAPVGGAGLSDYVLGGSGQLETLGNQLVQVELHAPQGGSVVSVTADGRKRPVVPGTLRGHDVVQTFVEVRAQRAHVVEFVVTAPVEVTELELRVTPGAAPERESRVLAVGCQ